MATEPKGATVTGENKTNLSNETRHHWQARDHALIAFVVIEILAVPLLLHLGHDRWFSYDDWDFLSSRSATSVHDLFEPHSVHWCTLPILYYRLLWSLFGIRSYIPYQFGAVAAHLTVVALLRIVIRRAGVPSWTATATMIPLIFLGSGSENIVSAFQITFTASIGFGLTQLLLADHDGALNSRDVLGLLAGAAGMLCSGVAISMVIAVGIAVLLRRGWRPAAFHTLPLGAAYALWFLAIGHSALRTEGSRPVTFSSMVAFLRTSVGAAFGRVSQLPGLGWVLAVMIIVGCAIAWRGRSGEELRRIAAAPAALIASAFVFLLIASSGRTGSQLARAPRYTYVIVALMLPAVAVAADALIRQRRAIAVLLALWLAVATFGNIRSFDDAAQKRTALFVQRVQDERASPAAPHNCETAPEVFASADRVRTVGDHGLARGRGVVRANPEA